MDSAPINFDPTDTDEESTLWNRSSAATSSYELQQDQIPGALSLGSSPSGIVPERLPSPRALLSIGSCPAVGNRLSTCRPCVFHNKKGGCRKEMGCDMCHTHEPDKKIVPHKPPKHTLFSSSESGPCNGGNLVEFILEEQGELLPSSVSLEFVGANHMGKATNVDVQQWKHGGSKRRYYICATAPAHNCAPGGICLGESDVSIQVRLLDKGMRVGSYRYEGRGLRAAADDRRSSGSDTPSGSTTAFEDSQGETRSENSSSVPLMEYDHHTSKTATPASEEFASRSRVGCLKREHRQNSYPSILCGRREISPPRAHSLAGERLSAANLAHHSNQLRQRVGIAEASGQYLDESSLLLIARFSASPPTIYALCMASKSLYGWPAGASGPSATKIMREVLRASMHRVLSYHLIPVEAVSFGDLRQANGVPSALISGSTMVQVALGEVWENSDVDIWCTEGVKHLVRDHIESFKFKRNIDKYGPVSWKTFAPKLLSTKIGSVEHWTMSKDSDASESEHSDSSESEHVGNKGDGSKLGKPLACQRQFMHCAEFKSGMDVVIGGPECVDPREMLASFDITICAIYYDGQSFHIPHPHLTFNRQSMVERNRASLMQGLAGSWLSDRHLIEFSCLDRALSSEWWSRSVSEAIQHCIDSNPDVDRSHLIASGDLCKSHLYRYFNFFLRFFQRLEKYLDRGIVIVGSPPHSRSIAKCLTDLERLPSEMPVPPKYQ